MTVPLLFQGAEFLAADKPAGWLSVPSRMPDADARPCLGTVLEGQLNRRLWPCHRLDAEVSGLMLYALNADAHRDANGWFEHRLVAKRYEAFSEGDEAALPAAEALWTSVLLRGKKRAYESPHGKACETRALALGVAPYAGGRVLRWELEPKTGRPHQLRFEMTKHGFPIVGDALYGAKTAFGPGGIALRCVYLGFARCPQAKARGLPPELTAPPLGTLTP